MANNQFSSSLRWTFRIYLPMTFHPTIKSLTANSKLNRLRAITATSLRRSRSNQLRNPNRKASNRFHNTHLNQGVRINRWCHLNQHRSKEIFSLKPNRIRTFSNLICQLRFAPSLKETASKWDLSSTILRFLRLENERTFHFGVRSWPHLHFSQYWYSFHSR